MIINKIVDKIKNEAPELEQLVYEVELFINNREAFNKSNEIVLLRNAKSEEEVESILENSVITLMNKMDKYQNELSEINFHFDTIEKERDEEDYLALEMESKYNVINLKTQHINDIRIIEIISRFIGLILSLLGLYMWYIKIQIPNERARKSKRITRKTKKI